jgi:hypothetical protein
MLAPDPLFVGRFRGIVRRSNPKPPGLRFAMVAAVALKDSAILTGAGGGGGDGCGFGIEGIHMVIFPVVL